MQTTDGRFLFQEDAPAHPGTKAFLLCQNLAETILLFLLLYPLPKASGRNYECRCRY